MFSDIDILKIVDKLNNEVSNLKKLKNVLLPILSVVIFLIVKYLTVSDIYPYLKFVSGIVGKGIIDEVFVNIFLVLLSVTFSFLVVESLIVVFRFAYRTWLHFFRNYIWDLTCSLEDWDFQGNVVIDKKEKAIHIINSNLGLILKKREWKNYQMTFEFKLPKTPNLSPADEKGNQLRRGFGVIYRAKNLGEYYMLKIDQSGYLPHVRHILWENNGPIFKTQLSASDQDKWIKTKFVMYDKHLWVQVGKDKFDFTIPTHSNVSKDQNSRISSQQIEDLPYSKIPFRDSGSIGFRSSGLEEVYIKNLIVKNLLCFRSSYSFCNN